MKSALIGYTGFIGSNILSQTSFTDLYNSKNIQDIDKKEYDLIVSAGTSSLRYKANQEPQEDLKKIKNLTNHLAKVKAGHFVLISTVDVYPNPVGVNEDSLINPTLQYPYGRNRYRLENFIKKHFKKTTFIRLPQTFGKGIKKNFVFDLIHNNALDFTDKDSMFQWYNLENVWKDIQIALRNKLTIVNFAVEPISAKELADYSLDLKFSNKTKQPPLHYDVRTKYGSLYGSLTEYIYNKKDTLNKLKTFIIKGKNNA